jgi:hypothetical protein
VRPVTAVALPPDHRPGRGPRHHLVDADLGQHLHGQLAAIALRDALDHHETGVGRFLVPPLLDRHVEPVPSDRGHHGPCGGPTAIAEQERLADPQPLHGGRVAALRSVHGVRRTRGQRVDEKQRRAHGPPPPCETLKIPVIMKLGTPDVADHEP